MVINLDPWLNLSSWTEKKQVKGVKVIDKCLQSKFHKSKAVFKEVKMELQTQNTTEASIEQPPGNVEGVGTADGVKDQHVPPNVLPPVIDVRASEPRILPRKEISPGLEGKEHHDPPKEPPPEIETIRPEPQLEESRLVVRPEQPNGPSSRVETQGKSITVKANFTLNEKRAISKKIEACDRINYDLVNRINCAVITFSTAAFKIFRSNIYKFYDTLPATYEVAKKEEVDNAGNVTHDIIRISDLTKRRSPMIYTVNLYRTTSRVMINGPHHEKFIDEVLPMIAGTIDDFDEELGEINAELKETLQEYKLSMAVNSKPHNLQQTNKTKPTCDSKKPIDT